MDWCLGVIFSSMPGFLANACKETFRSDGGLCASYSSTHALKLVAYMHHCASCGRLSMAVHVNSQSERLFLVPISPKRLYRRCMSLSHCAMSMVGSH